MYIQVPTKIFNLASNSKTTCIYKMVKNMTKGTTEKFRIGRPPQMTAVEGKPAVIKNVLKVGNSYAVHLPIEWMYKHKFPSKVSMSIADDGSLIIRKFEENIDKD